MKLTNDQKDILNGKYGEGMAKALEIQVGVGNAFDADIMVPITRTHVALSSQDADCWFAETMLEKGAKCIIPPTVNPSVNLKYLNEHLFQIPERGMDIVTRTNKAYRELGAQLTFNCTPYLQQNVPAYGEVIAFSESSATPYVNSVIGARTNRESSQSALCAAITGMVPRYGLLLDENRKGEILVEVQADIKEDFDFELLGWTYPLLYKGLEIPVFTGIHKRPTPEGFMNFGAELNTSGACGMYHMVGITPEAPTIEHAFGNNKIKEKIVITNDDIQKTREMICGEPKKIDFAMLGCPHLSINQVKEIAEVCDGEKFAVDVWILTSSLTKELAKRMGYLDSIQRAGGHILTDTCIDVPPCWQPYYGKVGVTNSPKNMYYNEMRDIEFIIRPIKETIKAAIKGRVE